MSNIYIQQWLQARYADQNSMTVSSQCTESRTLCAASAQKATETKQAKMSTAWTNVFDLRSTTAKHLTIQYCRKFWTHRKKRLRGTNISQKVCVCTRCLSWYKSKGSKPMHKWSSAASCPPTSAAIPSARQTSPSKQSTEPRPAQSRCSGSLIAAQNCDWGGCFFFKCGQLFCQKQDSFLSYALLHKFNEVEKCIYLKVTCLFMYLDWQERSRVISSFLQLINVLQYSDVNCLDTWHQQRNENATVVT